MAKTIGQLYASTAASAIESTDLLEIETASGISKGALASLFLPPGIMQMFAGASIPSGWLLCDGSEISRSTYASLFTAISTTWGIGDNSTTFNLPDMREACPQGAGTYSAVTGTTHGAIAAHDARALGAFADDQGQGHFHGAAYFTSGGANSGAGPYIVGTTTAAGRTANSGEISISAPTSDGTNGTPRVGTVTRGKTIGVNYIIKY